MTIKDNFPTLDEVGTMTCVVTAAVIALILMVSHALWKSIAGEAAPDSRNTADRQ